MSSAPPPPTGGNDDDGGNRDVPDAGASMRPRLLRPHLLRGGQSHTDGHYAARSVYGSIIVLALLLALNDHPPGPFRAAVLIAGTVLAVLAAETYADILGLEIDLGRPTTRPERRRKLRELSVVLVAAEAPILIFLLAGFGAIDEDNAFDVAIWATVALLFADGYLARRLAGRSRAASIRSACAVGGLGIALAVFKSLAHG